jgi:hypothetical protein
MPRGLHLYLVMVGALFGGAINPSNHGVAGTVAGVALGSSDVCHRVIRGADTGYRRAD